MDIMRFRNNNGASGAAILTAENVGDAEREGDVNEIGDKTVLVERSESLQDTSSQDSDDGSGGKSRTRKRRTPKYKNFYVVVSSVIGLGLTVTLMLNFWPVHIEVEEVPGLDVQQYTYQSQVQVPSLNPLSAERDGACLFHNCFDIYRCGYSDNNKIKVYIYPPTNYVDENNVPIKEPYSKEFKELLEAVADSEFHTYDPDQACLFIPAIDMLNQNNIRPQETGRLLASLPTWDNGTNHLIFNMLPGTMPDYNQTLDVPLDKAIIAGGAFSIMTYRSGFDVSIPVYNPIMEHVWLPTRPVEEVKPWLLVSSQFGIHTEFRQKLITLTRRYNNLLMLDKCELNAFGVLNYTKRCDKNREYMYPAILQEASFCLVMRGARLGQAALGDVMKAGCIPVVVSDTYVMPFNEVLDWPKAHIRINEERMDQMMDILGNITMMRIVRMRKHVDFFYKKYFSSMKAIALTTIELINDRVFRQNGKTYKEWNDPPYLVSTENKLFLPTMSIAKNMGYTAVILTFDRLPSLFKVIGNLGKTKSLAKIVIIWNNQEKAPPKEWPKIKAPLKIIQTKYNVLSNRFYPYDEIETDCVLAIDDDIVMINSEELEFGYQTWREFPDRLVGFPNRQHLFNNLTGRWEYSSEWKSSLSMILTGAAFHHKYYSYIYYYKMPGHMKEWVDEHMNCEDVAMNMMVYNLTGKPPIKIGARKKFMCMDCPKEKMLSQNAGHMTIRSSCVDIFQKIFGMIPLRSVEFRADPVLFKEKTTLVKPLFNITGET